jgi:hypothetical protein
VALTVVGQTCATEGGCGCCSCVSVAAKDRSPGVVRMEENTLPVEALSALCNFIIRIPSLVRLKPRQLEE